MTSPLRFRSAEATDASVAPSGPGQAVSPPPPGPAIVLDPTLQAAKRAYAEQFGDVIVQNTYWKVAVLALSLVCLALVGSQVRVARTIRNFKPLVIRIDTVGKAEAVRYDDMTYTPREAEIKYFLAEFVRLYYSRNRSSLPANFRSALAFMEPELASAVSQAWARQKLIETYGRSNLGDIDTAVKTVSIASLQRPPYQAVVEFEQIYYGSRERTESNRVLYTAHFAFTFATGVLPTAILATNPLGMVIHYFREDAAINGPLEAGK
jgi:type IV secretory pathway TrbF-like protein